MNDSDRVYIIRECMIELQQKLDRYDDDPHAQLEAYGQFADLLETYLEIPVRAVLE